MPRVIVPSLLIFAAVAIQFSITGQSILASDRLIFG